MHDPFSERALPDVLDVVPLGVAVVDVDGVVKSVNERLAEMVGLPVAQLVRRSLLDFVVADDAPFAVEILAAGLLYRDQVMGPVRIRYRDASGRERFTEFWARNCVDVAGIEGYVLTLAEESVADQLSDAVRSIAAGQPIERTLELVTAALGTHPVVAVASVLMMRDDELVPVGPWPIERALVDGRDRRSPWRAAVRRNESRDFDALHGLPDGVRRAAHAAGFSSVWVRPFASDDGSKEGAIVLWRNEVGWPSPNQERRIADAVAIVSLALDQADYHASMRNAVFIDNLTGVGSRARLADVADEAGADTSTVLYVDLDGFKYVNDRFGHAAGDAVLVEVGRRLQRALREHDEVIRVGGDEFVLVCRSMTSIEAVTAVADRVVGALAMPFDVTDEDGATVAVCLSASVGMAVCDLGLSFADRVRAADQAMYDAKFDGKNRWRLAARRGAPVADRTA